MMQSLDGVSLNHSCSLIMSTSMASPIIDVSLEKFNIHEVDKDHFKLGTESKTPYFDGVAC